MLKKVILLSFLFGASAFAAQSGRVVVEQASVYEFPQKGAKVVGKLPKDSVHTVSNLKTEGYYKIRLSGGATGWISGNDLLAGGGEALPDTGPSAGTRVNQRVYSDELIDGKRFAGANLRIQFGLGLSNLAFGGLSERFTGTAGLNFGKSYSLEIQRKLAFPLSLALRGEIRSAKSGVQDLGGGKTQTLEQYSVPLQVGLVFLPIHTERFRIGLGAYGGIAIGSFTEVVQITTAQTNSVKFASMDFIGTGSVQAVYGLGRAFGVFAEFAYSYQRTSELPATTALGSIPAFKIDYSGYLFRGGLELRF
jgi:hypothetical protein